jgi:lysozyme family protein
MTDLNKLAAAEARRWAAMHIDPKRKGEFVAVAKRLVAPAAKARYLTIQARTGVPWWFTAVAHEREAGQRFDRQLGQGDALEPGEHSRPQGTRAVQVVRRRRCGCPRELRALRGAAEGLECRPSSHNAGAIQRSWLRGQRCPSPYDWSGTDQYRSGKYVADHVYSASAVDRQLGCAALLACMAELDPDVHFDNASRSGARRPLWAPRLPRPRLLPPRLR